MRKLAAALAFLAALIPAVVSGQQFPLTMGPSTVYGRLGIGTGPGQAIPLSVLAAQPSLVSRGLGVGTSPIVGGTSGSLLFNNAGALGEKTLWFTNVKDVPYSATCDGTAVDTTKIQTAATAAASAKVALYIPSICKIDAAIDVSGVPRIFCSWMGIGGSNTGGGFISTSATANILSKNSTSPIIIENCAIQSSVTRTAGAGIVLAGHAEGDVVRGNFITDQWRGVQCDACINPLIEHNQIISYGNHAVHLQNVVNADSGEAVIAWNLFDTAAGGTTVGLYYLNSGGLNFRGNYVLHGTFGFLLDRDNGIATGILHIADNTFDTQTQVGVVLQATGTGTFHSIIASNNIFAGQVICLQTLGANANITNLLVSGGICNYSTTGASLQAGGLVSVTGVQFNAGGGNPAAITTAAAWPSSGEIGRNFYYNTNTRYTLTGNTAIATIGAGPPKTTAPALTSCGTSPGITGDDRSGFVQMGTGTPTGCVITFAAAYPATPRCIVNWRATPLASQSYTYTTAAITLTQTATSSNFVDYRCDPAS